MLPVKFDFMLKKPRGIPDSLCLLAPEDEENLESTKVKKSNLKSNLTCNINITIIMYYTCKHKNNAILLTGHLICPVVSIFTGRLLSFTVNLHEVLLTTNKFAIF